MRVQHASNCHGYSPGSVSHYHAPLTGCVVSVSVSVWGGCGGFTGSRPVFLDCVADGGQGQGGQGGGAGDHREGAAGACAPVSCICASSVSPRETPPAECSNVAHVLTEHRDSQAGFRESPAGGEPGRVEAARLKGRPRF